MSSTTEWISAISNGVLALGSIGLVCYAGRSFEEWQRQRRAEWWNSTAKDILVRGNAFHRSCSSLMARATGDVVRRYWSRQGTEMLESPGKNTAELIVEQSQLYHDFMGALYVGEFTWGKEIRAHYGELHEARSRYDAELTNLLALAQGDYDDVEDQIFAVAAFEHENPDRTNESVAGISRFMNSLSGTLRTKTYGTRKVEPL